MPKPIVFILGPSGSGKSQLAAWVAEDLQFLHLEIDRWPDGDGIDLEGLRTEWDAFLESGQATELVSVISKRIADANKEGAILSFPGKLVLQSAMMDAAESQGVRFLILYGTVAECMEAFLQRECQTGRGLDADHWILNNAGTYADFSRPEFSTHRLMGFEQSRHRVRGDLVAELMRRLTVG